MGVERDAYTTIAKFVFATVKEDEKEEEATCQIN